MSRKLHLALWTLLLGICSATQAQTRLEVVSAKPLEALSGRFRQSSGWTGGDGAASIPLGSGRTLWTFGDSFIGRIEDGRRIDSRLVNNTFAWQSLDDPKAPLRFFWRTQNEKSAAALQPSEPDTWYWPGDGAVVEGQLYLFCKHVRHREQGQPGFQFEWLGNALLQISNPQDQPTDWHAKAWSLPHGADDLRLASGCLVENGYLYVYGLFPAHACHGLDQPLAVARVRLDQLAKMDGHGWEFLCQGSDANVWSDKADAPAAIFRDGAPEMSVGRVPGWEGFIATYTSLGLGRDIVMRHALRPAGPWSDAVLVYRCPETDDKIFQYGAKAHAELSSGEGRCIVTYCRNIGSLSDHVSRPEIYLPQAIEVQLRLRSRD